MALNLSLLTQQQLREHAEQAQEEPVLLHVNLLLQLFYHSLVFTHVFLLFSFDLREP